MSLGHVSTVSRISAAVVLALLAVAEGRAVVRRDQKVALGVGLVAVMVPAGLFVAASTPVDNRILTLQYTMPWWVPLGLFAWSVLGLSAVRWWGERVGHQLELRWSPARVRAAATMAVVALLALVVGLRATPFDDRRDLYPV